ncbi:MAG: hypothetical protein AAF512_14650 [Pseudomonadota bacterium]
MERFIGVLASKNHIQASIKPAGKLRETPNDDEHLQALINDLSRLHPTLVILLAGCEEEQRINLAFKQAKLPLITITTRQANDFAQRIGQTEVNSELLAQIGQDIRPKSLLKDNKKNEEFNALLTRRLQVLEILVTEKNRMSASAARATNSSSYMQEDLQKHIEWLSRSLEDLDTHLKPFWLMQENNPKDS